jgi:uncharacterized glyoxalase superfamily protein PhnB
MTDASQTYPVLSFTDARKGLDFLKDVLGFESIAEHTGEDGELFHAELRFGSGVIMVSGSRKPDPANPWSTAPIGTYVYVEDIDAHHQRSKAAGCDIFMELREMEYGAREYSLRDADGHLWSFGTYRPAL